MANGNGRDLIGWSVTDCERAGLIGEGALRVVYDSRINRTGPMPKLDPDYDDIPDDLPEDDDDDRDHPSLTAAERNPSLK